MQFDLFTTPAPPPSLAGLASEKKSAKPAPDLVSPQSPVSAVSADIAEKSGTVPAPFLNGEVYRAMNDSGVLVVKQRTTGLHGASGWKFIHRTANQFEHDDFVLELRKKGWQEG